MDQFEAIVEPARQFAKDSIRLVNRCTKPDRKEYQKIAVATAIGFAIMGFIGFFVKLIHIPINVSYLLCYFCTQKACRICWSASKPGAEDLRAVSTVVFVRFYFKEPLNLFSSPVFSLYTEIVSFNETFTFTP